MTTNVKCIETGEVFSSISAATRCYGGNVGRAIRLKYDCHEKHFCFTAEPVNTTDIKPHIHKPKKTKTNPAHICPLCRVPICNCGWWHGLRPPAGAKTGIREIREYAKGKGNKRITVDRVIVVECPMFKEAKEFPLSIKQEPCYELANAVILTAVKDYRSARKAKDRHKVGSIRRFFRSEYFSVLSDLDGEVLIKKLDEETKNDKTGT